MRTRKVIVLLLVTICIMVITAGSASASNTYDFIGEQVWAVPQLLTVELGVLAISFEPLVEGANTAIISLPSGFELVCPEDDIAALQDSSILLFTQRISNNEFMVSFSANDVYNKITFVIPIHSTIPVGSTGDIELEIKHISGQFTNGNVVAGSVWPGEISIGVNPVETIKDGKSSVQITFSENMDRMFVSSSRLKLTLPEGFAWANVKISALSGDGFDIRPVIDGQVLILYMNKVSSKKSTFRVEADVQVSDVKKARGGEIKAEIEGLSNLSQRYIVVANYSAPEHLQPGKTVPQAVFTVGNTSFTHLGMYRNMDVAPYLRDGRVFLPLRYVGVSLDVDEINWDGQTATLVKDGVRVQVAAGSKRIVVNGQALTMDAAPELAPPGRIMLPYRYLAEAFEATVAWNQADRSVAIMLN